MAGAPRQITSTDAKAALLESYPSLDHNRKAEFAEEHQDLPERFDTLIDRIHTAAAYHKKTLPESLGTEAAVPNWQYRVANRHFTAEEKRAAIEYGKIYEALIDQLAHPLSEQDTLQGLVQEAKDADPHHRGGTPFDQRMIRNLVTSIFREHGVNTDKISEIHEFIREVSAAALHPNS